MPGTVLVAGNESGVIPIAFIRAYCVPRHVKLRSLRPVVRATAEALQRDLGTASQASPLPFYQRPCQLNHQKRKSRPCLLRSISGDVKTLSMLFCGSGYNPETELQLVIEKCK